MPNKEEYPKLQDKIVQYLFDNPRKVTFDEIMNLIKKPQSEAEYHCEVLQSKRLIEWTSSGNYNVPAYQITETGRRYIMEQ